MFAPATIERPITFGEVFYQELDPGFSREPGIVSSGSGICKIGTVLGQVTRGAATAIKTDVPGAGKGVITLADPAVSAAVKPGLYTILFIEPAANAGAFEVRDPDGDIDGAGTVGVAYDGAVKFTIADGATDFVAGDIGKITVAIATGTLEYKPHDPAAVDGSQHAAAVLGEAVDATTVDQRALIVARLALLRLPRLIFKAGISADDKAAALASLAKSFLLARDV